MDNNPADSSSESDISDPWSLIDRDSCDTDEGTGAHSGMGSVCGEQSDGESLEVIDEENPCEFQETGIDTDGVSIITDSEINEELEPTLPSALSKEKKYLHHPNTYLNTRLTVLVALSVAAVAGLGVGHFLGLQEECPVFNNSLTIQLADLQRENAVLQQKLNQLLQEGQMSLNHRNTDLWMYRSEPEFRTDMANLCSRSELQAEEQSSQRIGDEAVPEQFEEFRNDDLKKVSSEGFFKVIQNNRELVHDEINDKLMEERKEKEIGSSVSDEQKDVIDNRYRIPADLHGGEKVVGLKNFIENLNSWLFLNEDERSEKYLGNVEDDSDIFSGMNVEEKVRNMRDDFNEDENVIKIDNKEIDPDPSFVIKDEENVKGTSSDTSETFVYPSSEEDSKILHEEDITVVDANNEEDIYPKILEDVVNGGDKLDENSLQVIKSTLELLKVYFDKDILSANTGSVLSSTFALAMENEESLVRLQNTIDDCTVREDNFCREFLTRMEKSASKLKETSEDLVEDIDELMHKLLTKIERKLRKFKNNVQKKWCNLKQEYDGTNDWLESSVLVDCRENQKEHNSKSKKYGKFSSKIIKTSEKYENKVENPEIIVDKSSTDDGLSEIDDMDTVLENGNTQNSERIFQKNWEQSNHNAKNSYKKGKRRSDSNENFLQNKRNKFVKTNPIYRSHQEKTWKGTEPKNKDSSNKESMNYKRYVILDHAKTWPSYTIEPTKQSNVSGDWILKLANGRAEQRKISHRSDWVFDRADARKIKREKYQIKDDWYFERARGREDCRYGHHSDRCKGGNVNDWDHHDKHENDRKLPQHNNRWTKKLSRSVATAGKWVKDSFSRFQNKMNYYHH